MQTARGRVEYWMLASNQKRWTSTHFTHTHTNTHTWWMISQNNDNINCRQRQPFDWIKNIFATCVLYSLPGLYFITHTSKHILPHSVADREFSYNLDLHRSQRIGPRTWRMKKNRCRWSKNFDKRPHCRERTYGP